MEEIKNFYNSLLKIKYGWYDKNGVLHKGLKDGNFIKDYKMQDTSSIFENGYAICWELCELERDFFEKSSIPFVTFLAAIKLGKRYFCHTFLVYKEDEHYYWFEASWDKMKGIHEYSSIGEIFNVVRENFSDFTKSNNFDKNDITFYKYHRPRKGSSSGGFYRHCLILGKKIKAPFIVKGF